MGLPMYTLHRRPRAYTWDIVGDRCTGAPDTIIHFHWCVTQEGQITVMNSSDPSARSNDSKYG